MLNGQANWLTIPLIKEKGRIGIPLNETRINMSNQHTMNKNLKSISQNYSKAPYFNEIMPLVEDYFSFNNGDLIVDNNFKFIEKTLDLLDIKPRIIFSSDLDCKTHSTDLLVEIVKKVEGKTFDNYVSWLMTAATISLTGCPSLAVPCSNTNDSLPIGIQIIGKRRNEGKVLNLGHNFQRYSNNYNITPLEPN